MSLTDTAIKKAKPGEKPVKLSDSKGLYLRQSGWLEALALEIPLSGQREGDAAGGLPGRFTCPGA